MEDIRKSDEEIKIIVMTAFDEITYIPRAKAAGANGFIYKSRSLNDFLEVARAVMAGGSSFPEPKTIPLPQGEAPLTDREMEVLRLMCKHMTTKEIAQELFISENTVKYHKMNMLGKTGFSKAVDLAFYMISNGWLDQSLVLSIHSLPIHRLRVGGFFCFPQRLPAAGRVQAGKKAIIKVS